MQALISWRSRRTPLLRLMTWAAVLISALFFLMVFPFAEIVTQSFATEVEMANFLGLFSALATAATFLVSLLGVNRLFARLGVVLTLLILPGVYLVGFATWLASFGLATAVPVRGSQWIAVNAIGSTAWSALFNVVPGRRRGEVMAFMSAVPTQLGTTAAGALLIAGSELSAAQISAIGLTLAGGLLLLVLRMRSAYSAALVDAVRGGNLEVFTLPQAGPQKPLLDADTQRALTGELNAPEPGAPTGGSGSPPSKPCSTRDTQRRLAPRSPCLKTRRHRSVLWQPGPSHGTPPTMPSLSPPFWRIPIPVSELSQRSV